MFSFIINPLVVLLSLSTASGVLIHDVHFDKVASISIPTMPALHDTTIKAVATTSDPHTHPERMSLRSLQHPRIQPRVQDDRKYLLEKQSRGGGNTFDNAYLPLS